MASSSTAGTRPGGRRGLLRALVFLPFMFVLAFAILVIPPVPRADAWSSGTPTPVAVGTLLRSPAARMLAVGVGTGPIGIGLGVASLGLLAYQTKDSWWPVLAGALNGESSGKTTSTGANTQIADVAISGGNTITVTFVRAQGMQYSSDFSYVVDQVYCHNAAAGATSGPGTIYEHAPFPTMATSFTDAPTQVCGAGYSIQSLKIVPQAHPFDSYAYSAPVAAENWTQTTTVQCRQPDGTLVEISDTLTGQPDRVAVPSCADRVPGSIPWSGVINGGAVGTTPKEIQTWTTKQDVFDEYADCFGPTGLQCVIKVWVDGQPCTVGNAACASWPLIQVDDPSRVQCRFGSHLVGIGECRALKRAYRTDTQVQTITETNPDGSPHYPEVDPAPTTGSDTLAPPDPMPDVKAPTVDPTNPDGSKTENCNGEGYSWNPISWVVTPLKCVFIPSEGVGSRAERLKDKYKGRAPFAFMAPVWAMAYGVNSNCPDWRIKIGSPDGVGFAMDKNVVCDSEFTAAIVNSRPFLTAGMLALAFWPFARGMIYAATPILKPTPTEGK